MDQTKVYKGSRWLKFDFHTHTPISYDFGEGDPEKKNISALEWLKSAMEAKLDCVAVTDHNTAEWIDLLKKENEALKSAENKPEWYRDLTIFPGVEITSDSGSSRVHILAIFDPQKTTSGITAVLGSFGIMPDPVDYDGWGTEKSFNDVSAIIRRHSGIAIAAHAKNEKGLLRGVNNLSSPTKKSLKNLSGIELSDPTVFNDIDNDLARAVRKLAIVQGSDAHAAEKIGSRYTWIKMGTPSLEALKLALMDFEYSVLNQTEDPNIIPSSFVSRLSIENMYVCGRGNRLPFTVDFNPHFNAFIGGRGSGKSTVLESIRIAGRQGGSLKEGSPETYRGFEKFCSLATDKERGMMREETKISLEMMRGSYRYRLNWHFRGSGYVLEEFTDDSWVVVEDYGNLAERFPLLIYSQKQIHELSKEPSGLLGIIDRSSEVNKSEWLSRFSTLKGKYLELKTRYKALIDQIPEESTLKASLIDVENDLKIFEEGGHRAILLDYQKNRQQTNALPLPAVFDQFVTDLQDLAESIELSDFPIHLFDPEDAITTEMIDIYTQTTTELADIVQTLNTAKNSILEVKKAWLSRIQASAWFKSAVDSEQAYKRLISEYEAKEGKLSLTLYDEWNNKRDQLLGRLKEIENTKTEIIQRENDIKNTEKSMLAMHNELFERREQFIQKVLGDNPYVQMELIPLGDVLKIENQYRNILGLNQEVFSSAVYQSDNSNSILFNFINWEKNDELVQNLPEIINQIKQKTREIALGERSDYHAGFDKRLQDLYKNNPSAFDELDAWWPDDMLKVQYRQSGRGSGFEALEKGSDGQRAAAILAFLLSYGDEPLIIDQPEDDLDNALIYDLIVKQIHENKKRRQLIIATHNPNIVVNGDTELVHVMEFSQGQVGMAHQGDLGDSEIRNSICVIMEGGREAFDKRYKRVTVGDKNG